MDGTSNNSSIFSSTDADRPIVHAHTTTTKLLCNVHLQHRITSPKHFSKEIRRFPRCATTSGIIVRSEPPNTDWKEVCMTKFRQQNALVQHQVASLFPAKPKKCPFNILSLECKIEFRPPSQIQHRFSGRNGSIMLHVPTLQSGVPSIFCKARTASLTILLRVLSGGGGGGWMTSQVL